MRLGIYGTGCSGREVFDMIEMNPSLKKCWDEIIFIDDTKQEGTFMQCRMMPLVSLCHNIKKDDIKVVIAVGEPTVRKKLYDRVAENGLGLATIIHPLAQVSGSAKIGEGVVIQEHVTISSDAVLEDNVFINGKTIIGHDVHIGMHCQISSFSIVAGYTQVGEETYIGVSSSIRDHIVVGHNVIVSMGAVVMKDVRDNKVVMGNPAREIAENSGSVFK